MASSSTRASSCGLCSPNRGASRWPADHPLAAHPVLTIEHFIREPVVEVPVRDRVWSDFWTGASHRNGTRPQVGASVTTLDGLMEAIGAGLGIAITVAPAVDLLGASAGVAFRPVENLSPLQFWVARRNDDARPDVIAFLRTATAALETDSPPNAGSG
jgi:DNA-binding transcriptional LysR family regulator